jgi:hypothetical protein
LAKAAAGHSDDALRRFIRALPRAGLGATDEGTPRPATTTFFCIFGSSAARVALIDGVPLAWAMILL